MKIEKSDPIFVAGHRGLVGSAIVRKLSSAGYTNILTVGRQQVDLRNQLQVNDWFAKNKPKFVYLVAGTVGGILANSTRPAEFIYDNIMIHANVIDAAYKTKVTKLLYLGSSCIYPRNANQPMAESELLTGELEPTNEWYAIAKISGIKMCSAYRRQYGCDFISGMPTNLYGPNDNFDLTSSHVLPALIRKFHDAKMSNTPEVVVWGTGQPKREFLHVEDLAEACLFLMKNYSEDQHINIGSGIEISIGDLARKVSSVVYPEAQIVFDTSKPDGTPRKLLDVSRLHGIGWQHQIDLDKGIQSTYDWYLRNQNN